ncbi:Acetyltransferase (GNAT) family protein [Piscibacillus halophilus]|uniref:Acetyltransferase (GNAT) family protein n=1 Tax=Piscibacillus halophilus TaxID=571933 RepID=A0A1H9DIF9_9BACI|nr:Acetyltransferase (GNAT) family protein [Piscibacillus halophilus]
MKVRKAVVEDAKGMAKVHVDSWRTTYAGVVPDEYLNNLSYDERENMWKQATPRGGVYVAENNEGEIVGFATGGPERSGKYPDYKGELYAIYILKDYQRQGIGKALMKPIVEGLIRDNLTNMVVLVLEDNPSKHFYEATGAKLLDTEDIEIGGKKLIELVYGWDDIRSINL